MLSFEISDMTCGHCAQTVTKAVQSVDQTASVDVDLGAHEIRVRSDADVADLVAALQEAGYSAQLKTA